MIQRRISLPILACLATALAGAAPARAQYGSSPPPEEPRSHRGSTAPASPATPAQLHAGAACLIGRDAAAADPLFASAPYSAQERQLALRLGGEMQHCLHQQGGTTSVTAIRGALAEAAYERRFTAPPAARSPAPAVAPLLRPELATTRDDAASLVPQYALAECTVAQRPDLVIALLQTEPVSPASQAAFQALNPTFVACVPRGTQLSLDGRTIRGILAEELYRWSVVQRDGPASLWAAPAAAPAAPAAH
jgi:hypothetical protein